LGVDTDHSFGRLLRSAWIDHCDAAVMGHKCEGISAGGKCTTMNPAGRIIQILSTYGVERESLSPCAGLGSGINALDETREDPGVGVCRSCSKKNGVWVPSKGCNSAPYRFLQMLRNPPVILLFEITHGNDPSTRSYREFELGRRPAYKGSGSVDAEEDKSWLPS